MKFCSGDLARTGMGDLGGTQADDGSLSHPQLSFFYLPLLREKSSTKTQFEFVQMTTLSILIHAVPRSLRCVAAAALVLLPQPNRIADP